MRYEGFAIKKLLLIFMINVALIGFGYWGKNLARNFFANPSCRLHTIVDADEKKLAGLEKNFPGVRTSARIEDVLTNHEVNAIAIATQPSTHYNLAQRALQTGKHVLVEKPMTTQVHECEELIALANNSKLVLMPDHTFLYTGAVQKIKSLLSSDEIGTVNYIDSTRINLGLFQSDVNVLWDLAAHDISICSYLLNKSPVSVQATGISHLQNGIENIAYLTLRYPENVIAHFNCSWSSPVKIRQMLFGGTKKMIVYNDMEPTEKVKVYDAGYTPSADKSKWLIDYRMGDIFVPKLPLNEALAEMVKDFVGAIEHSSQPISNWKVGLEVVKVLAASQKSLQQNGQPITL